MRDDANLLLGARADVDEQSKRRVGHHDHELCFAAQLRQHLRLVRRGLGEDRVQRHDERLGELTREREDVFAVTSAEDPVLVLEQHDVDVEPPQHPGRSDVVATDRLRDRREQTAPLRARRLVHDCDEIRYLERIRAEESASQVGSKRTDPAGARRERGDDRGPHALGVAEVPAGRWVSG